MKKIIFIMFPVLILTNQVKPQEIGNQSSFENAGIKSNGNVTADVQKMATKSTKTTNNVPVITVEPDSLIQYGNYLGTCAPPVTYVVHGRYLTENLVISDNYTGSAVVSLTGNNDYVQTLTLVPLNGVVDTTIYVIHCPDFYDNQTYISNSSSGVEASVFVEANPVAGNAPVSAIGLVQAEPGILVHIPVKVSDYNLISQVEYVIEFNPDVLTFLELENILFCYFYETSVIQINPNVSQLIITSTCADGGITLPDNEILFNMVFSYSSGNTDLNFISGSFLNIWGLAPNDEPASEYYYNGSVNSSVKSTSVYLNLEGLYNPDLGNMNKAMGETEARFEGEVADQVTVKLASESAAYSTVFELDSVEVAQDGYCRFNVPSIYSGNYYLAVSHRNSIETWSSVPVSFNDSVVHYDFSTAAENAYGNNMKFIDGNYCFYGGDVIQDGMVDTEDMTPVDNQACVYATGYLPTDVNGDGMIDTWDMTFIENNSVDLIGKIFPSSDALPMLTTDSITDITITTALCHGRILQQGSSQLTAQGVCWDTSPEPTTTDSHTIEAGEPGFFESNVTGLIPNTLYYIRTYATNNEGTSYGNEMRFNSTIFSPGNGLTDYDNNHYSTVIIGYQEWMAENLNVTHYRNGDPIPNVTDITEWSNLTTGAFCWYNNDEIANSDIYGALYNWYTVIDSRSLCPEGWHVPTDAEWTELIINYLGGAFIANAKMRSTNGWINFGNGSNISGFSGLPGGIRYRYSISFTSFILMGEAAGWWSCTETNMETAYYRYLEPNFYVGWFNNWKNNGYSVRCLKE